MNEQINKACKLAHILACHKYNGCDKWVVKSVTTIKVLGEWGGGTKAITDTEREHEGKISYYVTESLDGYKVNSYDLGTASEIAEKLVKGKESEESMQAGEIARILSKNRHKGSYGWYVSTQTISDLYYHEDGKAVKKDQISFHEQGSVITIKSSEMNIRYDLNEAWAIVKGLYNA